MKKFTVTTVLVTTLLTSTAHAVNVLPINSKPFGQSYAEWGADFTRWIYAIPYNKHPLVPGNLNCTQPQFGPVWFIGTGTNTSNSQSPYFNSVVQCNIPAGKAVMVHVGFYSDTWPCPDPNFKPAIGQSLEEFLTLDAKSIVDQRPPNGLNIDGHPVLTKEKALKMRVTTNLFKITGNLSLKKDFDTCITGKPQPAVSSGHWVIIKGLKPGLHTFTFTDGSTMKVNFVNERTK